MKSIVWAAAAALCWSAPAGAERFELTGAPGAPYYAVTLGAEVYAHSRDAGLADLRILNGDGEPVPFSIDRPRDAAPQARTLQTVRWFAAPAEEDGKPGTAGVVLGTDGVLRATGPLPAQASARAWLLDLSPLRDTVTAVVVGLPAAEFQGEVSVQASDDLQHWRPVTRATLFHLANQGSTLVQDRIELAGVHAKYLRLTWQGKPPVPDAVRVELASGMPAAPADSDIQWRTGLAPVQVPATGDYLFDTGGAFPVERVKVRLPQTNTVVQATLSARANARAPWRPVTSARLFRLAGVGGRGEQESPPMVVPATGERYWRLQVDTRSGGLGAGCRRCRSAGGRPPSSTRRAVTCRSCWRWGGRRRQPGRPHGTAGGRIACDRAGAIGDDDGLAAGGAAARAAGRRDAPVDSVGRVGGRGGRAGWHGLAAVPRIGHPGRHAALARNGNGARHGAVFVPGTGCVSARRPAARTARW